MRRAVFTFAVALLASLPAPIARAEDADDTEPAAVEDTRAGKAELAADFNDLDEALGEFDYIIDHGVFS